MVVEFRREWELEGRMLEDNRCPEEERRVFRQIWKSGAPSKVVLLRGSFFTIVSQQELIS